MRKSQSQRNRAKEIAAELETVTDYLKANSPHIVPPERTLRNDERPGVKQSLETD
ncbi:hypothetical protein [Vibrio kanaloae]|uniref:hypothetical protein n=1 Tax=Vibrio kanaloae TaxID=170673 RepID=UPI0016488064|nr:hypothetical protein [Vibrio kanaloae]